MAALQAIGKSPESYRTISEAATELDLPQHVLRFWETRFPQIRPMKRGGGRRYYRPEDVDLLKGISIFLYARGFTIRGLQKIIKDQGVNHIIATGRSEAASEKPKGPEIIPQAIDLTRTRARLDRRDENTRANEEPKISAPKQPAFARNLIETLSQRLDPPDFIQTILPIQAENTMIKEPPQPTPAFTVRTSFSPSPASVVNVASNNRASPTSPAVKFHPIDDELNDIPPFILQREPAPQKPNFLETYGNESYVPENVVRTPARDPLPSERHLSKSSYNDSLPVKVMGDDQKRLQQVLAELNDCRRLLGSIMPAQ